MQFWPRKRSRHSLVRVRSWAPENQVKPLGFIGYKAGMTHLMVVDNRPKSLTKGEKISMPVSIVECPPMFVVGVSFYKNSRKVSSVLSEKFDKNISRTLTLPKKPGKKIEDIQDFDSIKLLVHSTPSKAGFGTKKPKLLEMVLGGNKNDQLVYAKENLGKEISIENVFSPGNQVDVHGVTKGKGFQGTVKRYGVPIRQHKSEKTKRGIGNLGAWTPKRVDYRVAQAGKMGYHLRTEYNKQIIKIGDDGSEVTPDSGIQKYGVVKNSFVLVKGSVAGSKKRALVLTKSIRPNIKVTKDAPEVAFISA